MENYFKDLLTRYPNLLRISKNSLWIMADSLFRFGVGFIVSIWMARSLGPAQFGIFNYVLTFMAVLTSMMGLGLDVVVVRMLSRDPGIKDRVIASALSFRLVAALVVFIGLGFFLWNCQGMPVSTRWMVTIISIGLFFQCFDVIDYYFQSRLLSKYVVLAKSGIFFIASVVKMVLIITKSPLISFVFVALLEIVLGGLSLLMVYKIVNKTSLFCHRPDWKMAASIFRQGWPLGLSGLSTCIYMRIDQFVITHFLGNAALGVYIAALRLSEMWYFIPIALVTSITPKIIELKHTDPAAYKNNLQKVYQHIFLLALLFSVTLSLSSLFSIRLLFGEAYSEASTVLFWHACPGFLSGWGWSLIFGSLLRTCSIIF